MLTLACKLYLKNLRIASLIPAKIIRLEDSSEKNIKIANVNIRNSADEGIGESLVVTREFIVSIDQLNEFSINHNDSIEVENKILSIVEPIPDYIGAKIVSYRFGVR